MKTIRHTFKKLQKRKEKTGNNMVKASNTERQRGHTLLSVVAAIIAATITLHLLADGGSGGGIVCGASAWEYVPTFIYDLSVAPEHRWDGAVGLFIGQPFPPLPPTTITTSASGENVVTFDTSFGPLFNDWNQTYLRKLSPSQQSVLVTSVAQHFPEHWLEMSGIARQFCQEFGHCEVTTAFLATYVWYHEVAHAQEFNLGFLEEGKQKIKKNHQECTGILVLPPLSPSSDQQPPQCLHGRNLDQGFPSARNTTLNIKVIRSSPSTSSTVEVLWEATDLYWASSGYVTAHMQGFVTLEENWRYDHTPRPLAEIIARIASSSSIPNTTSSASASASAMKVKGRGASTGAAAAEVQVQMPTLVVPQVFMFRRLLLQLLDGTTTATSTTPKNVFPNTVRHLRHNSRRHHLEAGAGSFNASPAAVEPFAGDFAAFKAALAFFMNHNDQNTPSAPAPAPAVAVVFAAPMYVILSAWGRAGAVISVTFDGPVNTMVTLLTDRDGAYPPPPPTPAAPNQTTGLLFADAMAYLSSISSSANNNGNSAANITSTSAGTSVMFLVQTNSDRGEYSRRRSTAEAALQALLFPSPPSASSLSSSFQRIGGTPVQLVQRRRQQQQSQQGALSTSPSAPTGFSPLSFDPSLAVWMALSKYPVHNADTIYSIVMQTDSSNSHLVGTGFVRRPGGTWAE